MFPFSIQATQKDTIMNFGRSNNVYLESDFLDFGSRLMGEAAGPSHHRSVHALAPSNATASPITEQASPLEPRSNMDLGRSADRGSHEVVQSKVHVGLSNLQQEPSGDSAQSIPPVWLQTGPLEVSPATVDKGSSHFPAADREQRARKTSSHLHDYICYSACAKDPSSSPQAKSSLPTVSSGKPYPITHILHVISSLKCIKIT